MNASSGSGEWPKRNSIREQSESVPKCKQRQPENLTSQSPRDIFALIRVAMRAPNLVLHLTPARMLFRSVKHIGNSASDAEYDEVSKSKQRDKNAFFVRHIAQIAQQDFQKRFAEP